MSDTPEFSPRELERLRKLAAERLPNEPNRIEWQEASPTPPAVLEILHAGNYDPLTGMPQSPDRVPPVVDTKPGSNGNDWFSHLALAPREGPPREPMLPAQRAEQDQRYMEAYRLWASLSAQSKTQLAACTRWQQENHPYWLVQLTATNDRSPDPSIPPVVLKAPTQSDAEKRYTELCGVTGWDHSAAQLTAALYVEAA
jgi:hypothetical protein